MVRGGPAARVALASNGTADCSSHRQRLNSHDRTGAHGLGVALHGAQRRRTLAPFQSGNRALGRAHERGHVALRHSGAGARGNQLVGHVEFGGLLFRTGHLFFVRSPVWGLAWATKILTDPFHNIAIYWKSPWALMHGQRFDPMGTDRHPAQP